MSLDRRSPVSRYDAVAAASSAVVIGSYSTSFGWACRLLPEPDRAHVRNIYALVRLADEIVDDLDPSWPVADRAEMLDALEAETHRAVRTGRSANLVVHAFAGTAREHGITAELIAPFFASMRADLSVTDHDETSLAEYVHGSAEVVGLMCLRVFLRRDEDTYARLAPGAARLGAAFQKVNFLRDLAEDRDALGRTYFSGLDPATFGDSHRDLLLDDIDADLAAAEQALLELPAGARRAVRAAHLLFAELSRRLRSTPAAEIRSSRVRVPDTVKARLVLRATLSGGRR